MVEIHTAAAAEPIHAILGTGGSNHIELAGSITTSADSANGVHFLGGNNNLDITGNIKTLGSAVSVIYVNSKGNIVTVSGAIEALSRHRHHRRHNPVDQITVHPIQPSFTEWPASSPPPPPASLAFIRSLFA